jgi:hypothetical protein
MENRQKSKKTPRHPPNFEKIKCYKTSQTIFVEQSKTFKTQKKREKPAKTGENRQTVKRKRQNRVS